VSQERANIAGVLIAGGIIVIAAPLAGPKWPALVGIGSSMIIGVAVCLLYDICRRPHPEQRGFEVVLRKSENEKRKSG